MTKTSLSQDLFNIPYRPVDLPRVNVDLQRREDGSLILRSLDPEPAFEPTIIRAFLANASAVPERDFLGERGADGEWIRLSFAEAAKRVRAIGQWLLAQGLGQETPLMMLAGNSVNHAVLRLGAMAAGVPVCPVSLNYAYIGGDFARLRHVIELVRPALVYVEAGADIEPALTAFPGSVRVISSQPETLSIDALALDDIVATVPGDAIAHALTHPDPDAHVAYMLTSG
ncbi:AMP-binding protein, partial [Congregibacter sp.]